MTLDVNAQRNLVQESACTCLELQKPEQAAEIQLPAVTAAEFLDVLCRKKERVRQRSDPAGRISWHLSVRRTSDIKIHQRKDRRG